MRKTDIIKQKKSGLSSFDIYAIEVGKLHLYDVAFFGHKGKPGDRKKTSRIWKQICEIFYPNVK